MASKLKSERVGYEREEHEVDERDRWEKCEMRRIEKISKRDEKGRLKLFMVCGTGTV